MLERELEQIPSQEELRGQITFSDQFNHNMQKVLKKERTKGFHHRGYYQKRAACIIILSIMVFGYTFSVEAIRTPVIQMIKKMLPSSMWFQYKSDDLAPKRLEREIAPPAQLEGGYSLISIDHYKRHDLVEYRDEQAEMIWVKRHLGRMSAVTDTDHNADEKIRMRGVIGSYFHNAEKCVVSWYEPSYTYEVHLTNVTLPKERVLEIIESFFIN